MSFEEKISIRLDQIHRTVVVGIIIVIILILSK